MQKYGFGARTMQNYFCKYTGAAVSRPGLLHDTVLGIPLNTNFRIEEFIFSQEEGQVFNILFLDQKIRILDGGSFKLETAKTVSSAATGGGGDYTLITTSSTHGYATGDLVVLSGTDVPASIAGQVLLVAAVPSTTTLQVRAYHRIGSLDDWEDAAPTASIARVYTLTSPYTAADLPSLAFSQARDVMKITSRDFAPRELIRNADGTWTLQLVDFELDVDIPQNLAKIAAFPDTDDVGIVFTVTAVDELGQESLPANPLIITQGVNYAAEAGWVKIGWDEVAGATRYNVYRSIILGASEAASLALDLGYISTVYAPEFSDNNYIPDYTKTPPQQFNPFANSWIKSVSVTAPGSGYAKTDTLAFTGGSNATGILVVNDDGEVIGVIITNPGQDYSSPGITITTSGGSGATFDITLGDADGNYPAVSVIHNQRQIYASSYNRPLAVWGSQIGLFNNFNISRIVAADESFDYDVASARLGVIRHLVSTRSGLLVFSDLGVWTLTGSSKTLTPTDVDAEQQTAVGASGLSPIIIDSDILYAENGNKTIRLLQYNDFSKNFGGSDISVLARELFDGYLDLLDWTYAATPFRLIYAVRNDGRLNVGTLSQEQQVYAWSHFDTRGVFKAITMLPTEEGVNTVYAVVERNYGGRVIVLEHFADRALSANYTHCGLDGASEFTGTAPAASIEFSSSVEVVASAGVFTADDVNKFIVAKSGRAVITNYVTSTIVAVEIIEAFTEYVVPYAAFTTLIPQGEWKLLTLVDEIQLPFNPRPSAVSIYGDAKLFSTVTVGDNGVVSLPEALSQCFVGLPYTCTLATLPLTAEGTIIEDSRKNIKGAGIRYRNSKGLALRVEDGDLYDIENEYSDFPNEGTKLRSGHEYTEVGSDWDIMRSVTIVSDGANMSEILGIVVDLEVGDDVS